MTQRFRLPMDAEQAYEYLLAANMAEVQFRHRRFIHTDSVEDQLRQMADWLTADSPKFGIVLCGGCGNGKTTMLKALQNLLNHLNIRNPNARSGFSDCYGLPVVDALHIANLCKTNHDKFLEMARYDTGYQLKNAGVISGFDSTVECAVAKLMCLQGKYQDPEVVRIMMNQNICGEITL